MDLEPHQQQSRKTLRDKWLQFHVENVASGRGLQRALDRHGPLDNWASLKSAPTARLEDELRLALQIAAADYDNSLVHRCIQRAITISEAGLKDERWSSQWRSTINIDYGRFLSAAIFVKAWACDAELDQSQLYSSGLQVCRGAVSDRPVWTELAQSEYISGTQLVLLAGSPTKAFELLQAPRTFCRVHDYYSWFTQFLKTLIYQHDHPDTVRPRFDAYFDKIRDPFFNPPRDNPRGENLPGLPLLRLRLALIRWIYIERQPVAGNWRNIIAQIGY